MKNIVFKGKLKENASIVGLLKEINNISCRISIDTKHAITIENIKEDMIDIAYNLADKYYMIDMINLENAENVLDLGNNEKEISNSYSAENLMNKNIEQLINERLIKTINWAMSKANASEDEIEEYIWSLIREISMNYSIEKKYDTSLIAVGDIVVCDYGKHLPGETNGSQVRALVCNTLQNRMIYIVPIINKKPNVFYSNYVEFDWKNDINHYYQISNFGNTIINLEKGKYVRAERIKNIVGKLKTEIFDDVLTKLPNAFNFKNLDDDIDNSPERDDTQKGNLLS